MRRPVLIIVIGLFILLSIGAVFLYFKLVFSKGCSVKITSNSDLVKVRVKNQKKLNEFIGKWLPCDDSQFKGGEPVTQQGPKYFRTLNIVFDDTVKKYGVYLSEDEAVPGGRDSNRLLSYDFYFDEEKDEAIVSISLTKLFLDRGDVSKLLAFIIASRVDMLNKYNSVEDRLDRTAKLETFQYSAEDAGIVYEFK